jgi:hypothetical protein
MTNMLRFTRGELKRRATQRNLLKEIVFMSDRPADARDIEIITLKQRLRDQAMSEAWDITPDATSVDQTIQTLLNTKFSSAKEFVEIENHHITVGINTPIVDDAAIDRALMLLIQVDDITKTSYIEFGDAIKIYGTRYKPI